MDYKAEILAVGANPLKLEQLYQAAKQANQEDAFRDAALACYEESPGNLLFAAWFYRFEYSAERREKSRRAVNWIAAVPLSIVTGLIFWALSDFETLLVGDYLPHIFLWWSPIAAMSALVFFVLTTRKNPVRVAALGVGLLAAAAYAVFLTPILSPSWAGEQYIIIAAVHIPLLSWIALGLSILGFNSSKEDRFAFLIKSVEVMITAGLYLIFGVAFGGITVGMFAALSIDLPELWIRLIAAGGFGLLPVLAVATVYDPAVSPSAQNFDQGLSKFIATMMRLLLPLTLAVLAVYIFVIPFAFMAPYQNRDVLIVYNLLLFGIVGLLMGATPIQGDDLSPSLQKWLRTGIIVVAVLVELISLYALSATVFRTVGGGLTPNRLTIIGWNTINIAILFWLIFRQFRDGRGRWIESLQSVFSLGTNAYLIWGLFLLVAVPLLF